MIAEIICVGTELLMGQIVNTNAQFMAEKLAPWAWTCTGSRWWATTPSG